MRKVARNKRRVAMSAGTLAALFLLLSLVLAACGRNDSPNTADHGSHNDMAVNGTANEGTGNAAADGASTGDEPAADPAPQADDGASSGNTPATDPAPQTDDSGSGGNASAADPSDAKAGNDGKQNAEPPKDAGEKPDDAKAEPAKDTKADPPPAPKPKPTPKPAPKPKPAPVDTKPKTYVVEIKEFAFATASLTIRPGDSVKFINRDTVKHTATADDGSSFDTGLLGQDEEKTVTFDKEGEFPYHCAPHPAMQATIIVSAK
ncbi:cupredoxin domain-containing protein [Paenibacillus montanisoli]|nr:cupredoxin family copper-binding protein [Paenibacillus montanisoli]